MSYFIRTILNPEEFNHTDVEHFDTEKFPSMTQPGMAEPMEVIYNRYLNGQPLKINPTYNLPPGFPDTSRMDNIDKLALQKELNQAVNAHDDRVKQREEQARTAHIDSLNARIKELESLQSPPEENLNSSE